MKTRRAVGVFVGFCAVVAALGFGRTTAEAQQPPPDRIVHFLVDVSGSMSTNGRLEHAKAALTSVVPTLSSSDWAGLRTFGVTGCDTRLNVDPGPLVVDSFLSQVAALQPFGSTPLAAGLAAAAADLDETAAARKTIVLLADGDNNCGGDPCQVARDIAARGTDLVVNTAGIELSGSARATLECIASATGGTYTDVSDPSDLADLLGGIVGQQLRYVALGDSYSSGEGAGAGNYFQWHRTYYRCVLGRSGVVMESVRPLNGKDVTCTPFERGFDIGCHRAPSAWSFELAQRSSQIRDDVQNAACSGSTISTNLLDKWKENEQPQDDRLRELNAQEQVDLVTFTVGGNDVGFEALAKQCFLANCSKAHDKVKKALGRIDLVEPIRQLHSAAPAATIAFVSYPQVVPADQDDATGCGWLTPQEREAMRNVVGELNLAQFNAVEQAKREGINAVFVDVTDALKGHELCTADSHMVRIYGNPANSEQAHPDSVDRSAWGETSGQQDYANAVFDRLRSLGVIFG